MLDSTITDQFAGLGVDADSVVTGDVLAPTAPAIETAPEATVPAPKKTDRKRPMLTIVFDKPADVAVEPIAMVATPTPQPAATTQPTTTPAPRPAAAKVVTTWSGSVRMETSSDFRECWEDDELKRVRFNYLAEGRDDKGMQLIVTGPSDELERVLSEDPIMIAGTLSFMENVCRDSVFVAQLKLDGKSPRFDVTFYPEVPTTGSSDWLRKRPLPGGAMLEISRLRAASTDATVAGASPSVSELPNEPESLAA